MGVELRVQDLLEAMSDSGRTPEEVCRDSAKLRWKAHDRWQDLRIGEAEFDLLLGAAVPDPGSGSGWGGSLPALAADEAMDVVGVDTRGPPAADTSDEFLEGNPSMIGRYRVVRCLGQGGFGRVYLAQDDELDRPVAIKIPSPERIAGPEDVEEHLREARALARLDHPRIVPVHDVGRTGDGLCYVVSKYIEGSDLAKPRSQGRWSIRESAKLVAVVADALRHAHSRGLVHRDIKPANILIDLQGEPWVADFGLALWDEDWGKESKVVGTPAYMSPEQARGEGHWVNGRSDIFSLGVVFYELLSGRRPFWGDTHAQVLEQILRTEEQPLRQIDDTIPR
jgi:serine/threonine protein kinase